MRTRSWIAEHVDAVVLSNPVELDQLSVDNVAVIPNVAQAASAAR